MQTSSIHLNSDLRWDLSATEVALIEQMDDGDVTEQSEDADTLVDDANAADSVVDKTDQTLVSQSRPDETTGTESVPLQAEPRAIPEPS